jgi:predicted kinase
MAADLHSIPLIFLIGIPGSGKSTLAARLMLQSSCLLISTDQIRAELFGDEAVQGSWRLIWQEVQRRFAEAASQIQAGQANLAIYDATNARRRYRREALALARSTGFTSISGIWLNPSLEVCLRRNQQRLRQVPEEVLQRMHRQLWSCPPRLREGLDLLLHYGTVSCLSNSSILSEGKQLIKVGVQESTEIAPSS